MSDKFNKILIADDEPDIIEFLQYNLEKNGFIVISAINGRQALDLAIKEKPDLILLDIMMPELDGVEVCRELRDRAEFKDTLIAFLTARSEDYSQIAGFEVGADDYMTKPIKPRVLVARIKALLKRKEVAAPPINLKQYGELSIDVEKRLIIINDIPYHLPKKEYEILNLLASKPGKVFTREEIYHLIWGFDIFVGDRTIDVHVRKIREKIGEDFIRTIKGIGYKFSSANQ
ncbi:MAG: response regulator transcription factor [Bacteroidales bacterium]|nr:response regulator transcription factor [Bacteroidales bacterium]